MKVTKRDGRIQDFDKNKIKVSIMRASDDAKIPLNTSDIENITDSILKEMPEKDVVEVIEIHKVAIKVLKDFGFNKIALLFDEASSLT
ncbi:ATP cone domain-containing protein [Clostridium grantii]|uniref:ATP cone domain-containing protein n=1 Tax=Clostridium grantii DSM 8605 TaxID=1121316 RepID=A0A1M5UNG4_9CLOT|nr:ATP cone domain-containing protein [Clostridium grantii]SHH64471.1 ATP cone domain-containing protein [Clostridium grantii DSM 8605]